jgi:hypothetical protein
MENGNRVSFQENFGGGGHVDFALMALGRLKAWGDWLSGRKTAIKNR